MGRVRLLFIIVLVFLAMTVGVLEMGQRKGTMVNSYLYFGDATKELTVANVSMTPDKSPQVTRRKMDIFIQRIKKESPEVDLIVFGETVLSWYRAKNNEYHRQIAEPVPGPSTEFISNLARLHEVNIAFGISENSDGIIYNALVFIDRSGNILQKHRKKNLRSTYFTPSTDAISFVEFEGMKAGLVICYDMQFSEAMNRTKMEEADLVILANTDYMDTWDDSYFGYKYLALRYGAWIVSGNRYGVEFETDWDGHIELVNPLGEVVDFSTGQEGYLVNTIEVNTRHSSLKRHIRNLYSYLSIGYLIIKHPRITLGYI